MENKGPTSDTASPTGPFMTLKMKLDVPNVDRLAAAKEVSSWDALTKSIVVRASESSTEDYYKELFASTQQGMRIYTTDTDASHYASFMKEIVGMHPELIKNDVFSAIDLSTCTPNLREGLDEQIDLLRKSAPHAKGEAESITFEAGYLNRKINNLEQGTVVVRRTSSMSVVLYLLPPLKFEAGAPSLYSKNFLPGGLSSMALHDADVGTLNSMDTVLGSLATISSALTYVEKFTPFFGLTSGAFTLLQLIHGASQPSDFDRMIGELRNIINTVLTEHAVRDHLSTLATFMDTFKNRKQALESSSNKPQYIRETFLPMLNSEVLDVAGPINKSAHDLRALWDHTGWHEIGLKQKIARAYALAVSYKLIIYQTRFMLLCELWREAYSQGQDIAGEYFERAKNAFLDYQSEMESSAVSPDNARSVVLSYIEKRREFDSIRAFFYAQFYGVEKAIIKDMISGIHLEEQIFVFGYYEARRWAEEKRGEHWNRIISETWSLMGSIPGDFDKMIAGFRNLKWTML